MKRSLMVFLLGACTVFAQESMQLRAVVHVRYFLKTDTKGQGLFLVGWLPTNFISGVPNNSNILFGFGYARKNWSVENMFQKQWSDSGNAFFFDCRFTAKPTERTNLYVEIAPRLDKKILYDFVSVDERVLGPLSVGFETENVHRSGKDTLGFGPRISACPLSRKFIGAKPVIAVSRQFRSQGPNVTRVYAIMNWVF